MRSLIETARLTGATSPPPFRVGAALRTVVMIAIVAVAPAEAAAARPRVVVTREALVHGATIRLGDVATLEGAAAQELAGLSLGRSPGAGEVRRLDGRAVLRRLASAVEDLASIAYVIPPSVRVRRAAQEIDHAVMRDIIERHLAEALGTGAAEAVLHGIELPGPVRIPEGEWTARVSSTDGAPLFGRTRLRVDFVVDGRPVRSAWVTALIELHGPVVVAQRPIGRGETIGAGDVAVEQRDLSKLPRDVLTEAAEAVAQVAQRDLVPFAPIRRAQVAPPDVVQRGDAVLLVAERGALRITALGEVREDAGRGEQVHVVNRTSRKTLIGRVLDEHTVAVDF